MCTTENRQVFLKLKVFAAFGVIGGLLTLLAACSDSSGLYLANATETWLVDTETNLPIEGAIVVANWQLEDSAAATFQLDSLVIVETISDERGRFQIPNWGPKQAPAGQVVINHAPEISIFKPGYLAKNVSNTFDPKMYKSYLRTSQWHGQTIKLKKRKGPLRDYYMNNLLSLETRMTNIIQQKCGWKHIPKMILALQEEKKILDINNITNFIIGVNQLKGDQCGSPAEFLNGYSK